MYIFPNGVYVGHKIRINSYIQFRNNSQFFEEIPVSTKFSGYPVDSLAQWQRASAQRPHPPQIQLAINSFKTIII